MSFQISFQTEDGIFRRTRAIVVPIAEQARNQPAGVIVIGLNPYRPLDSAYRGFIDLLAGQIAAGLADVRAYEREKSRAEALAEIDRAKTAFFSNTSHEFRTPLTLMLSPLEDLLLRSTRSGMVPSIENRLAATPQWAALFEARQHAARFFAARGGQASAALRAD